MVGRGVLDDDIEVLKEVGEFFIFEDLSIVSNNFDRTTKTS